MTNYYTSGAVVFEVDDKAHLLFVAKVIEVLNGVLMSGFYGGEPIEELSEKDKEFILDLADQDSHVNDLVLELIGIDGFHGYLEHRVGDLNIVIYNTENLSVNFIAELVQALLKTLDYDYVVAFSWADTDDSRVPDAHGGGAYAVSRHGMLWMDTEYWRHSIAPELFRVTGLSQSMQWIGVKDQACPKCKEQDFDCDGLEVDSGFAYQELFCHVCGTEWNNIYAQASIQIVNEGEVKDG